MSTARIVQTLVALAFLTIVPNQLRGQGSTSNPENVQNRTDQPGNPARQDETFRKFSLIEGVLNARDRMGLSLGVSEFYSPDILLSSEKQVGALTYFSSNVYTNFSRPKTQIHLDYGIGYRRDNRR